MHKIDNHSEKIQTISVFGAGNWWTDGKKPFLITALVNTVNILYAVKADVILYKAISWQDL